jgi:transcriptional regulator with XRE-family HTH domain
MQTTEMQLLIEGRRAAQSGRGARVREAAGISQTELAELAGVSAAAISRWEAGHRIPTGPSAIAYARALRQVTEAVVTAHG